MVIEGVYGSAVALTQGVDCPVPEQRNQRVALG